MINLVDYLKKKTLKDIYNRLSYDDKWSENELDKTRKELSKNGISDFMFGDNSSWCPVRPYYGTPYVDCNDAEALEYEIKSNHFRSWEAYDVIVNRLVDKFGYKRINVKGYDGQDYEDVVAPNEYKKYLKDLDVKNDFAKLINSGKEVLVRVNQEICWCGLDDKPAEAGCCTSKDHRGLIIDLNFDKFKDGRLKPYKNYKNLYYHVLDNDGNIIKTRTNYCYITGHTHQFDVCNPASIASNRIIIDVDTIRLA